MIDLIDLNSIQAIIVFKTKKITVMKTICEEAGVPIIGDRVSYNALEKAFDLREEQEDDRLPPTIH